MARAAAGQCECMLPKVWSDACAAGGMSARVRDDVAWCVYLKCIYFGVIAEL